VPGALPPVIGWVAVRGRLDGGALALFLIVFVWQVPHFLAIAWTYRDDYARGGLEMLTVRDRRGIRTAQQMLLYGLTLVPVSLTPVLGARRGRSTRSGRSCWGVLPATDPALPRERSVPVARSVLRASLVYLPSLLFSCSRRSTCYPAETFPGPQGIGTMTTAHIEHDVPVLHMGLPCPTASWRPGCSWSRKSCSSPA